MQTTKILLGILLLLTCTFPANANVVAPYALDEILFLKAEETRSGKWVASIRTPDNKIYKVTVGEVLGNNNGRIISITAKIIILQETITRSDGSRYTRKVTLRMLKK